MIFRNICIYLKESPNVQEDRQELYRNYWSQTSMRRMFSYFLTITPLVNINTEMNRFSLPHSIF